MTVICETCHRYNDVTADRDGNLLDAEWVRVDGGLQCPYCDSEDVSIEGGSVI